MKTENAQKDDVDDLKQVSRVVDNMAAAGPALGLDDDTVKRSKEAGCPAFRGSRVYLDELAEWIEDNPFVLKMSPGDEMDFRLKSVKFKSVLLDFEIKRGGLLARATVVREVRDFQSKLAAEFRRVLEVELPVKGDGMGVVELRALGKTYYDELCAKMQKQEGEWSKGLE